jgi:hypothetical protein
VVDRARLPVDTLQTQTEEIDSLDTLVDNHRDRQTIAFVKLAQWQTKHWPGRRRLGRGRRRRASALIRCTPSGPLRSGSLLGPRALREARRRVLLQGICSLLPLLLGLELLRWRLRLELLALRQSLRLLAEGRRLLRPVLEGQGTQLRGPLRRSLAVSKGEPGGGHGRVAVGLGPEARLLRAAALVEHVALAEAPVVGGRNALLLRLRATHSRGVLLAGAESLSLLLERARPAARAKLLRRLRSLAGRRELALERGLR